MIGNIFFTGCCRFTAVLFVQTLRRADHRLTVGKFTKLASNSFITKIRGFDLTKIYKVADTYVKVV